MLSETAEKIFKLKYAIDESESWEEATWRVASNIAKAELKYGKTEEEMIHTAVDFYNMMRMKYFIPGGRILKNAGTGVKNLFNCFFFNIGDSRKDIYQCLKDAAEVFAWGGGLGIRLSELREEGALIKSTNTKSSGPISFMELFNSTGDVIQQASRRAAEIALLDVSHPDIRKFFKFKSSLNKRNKIFLDEYKRNLKDLDKKEYNVDILEKSLIDSQLNHFNISVEIRDAFMEAVINDEMWKLISPSSGEVVSEVKARELLMEMAYQIWSSGDPGVFFTDNVNKDNMVKYISDVMGCNPCAEINLVSYEPCDLGSINLSEMVTEDGRVDFELLEEATRLGVRFLDDVHDMSENNVNKINEMASGLRRVGLGVFGFADLLVKLNIPYNSPKGLELGNYLSWFITFFAWLESYELAKERGAFPLYDKSKVDFTVVEKVFKSKYVTETFDIEGMKEIGMRNVSVTALAPTGSIALIGDGNSVIEPYFALAYRRYITLGEANLAKDTIIEVNKVLLDRLVNSGLTDEQIEQAKKEMLKRGTIQHIDFIPEEIRKVFVTAHDISVEDHIKMQAAWQEYVSNAISKTINLPSSAQPKDIYNAIILMWQYGLKSSTLYRNGSKTFQILNAGNSNSD